MCRAVVCFAIGARLISQVICFSSINRMCFFSSVTFVVVCNTRDHLWVLSGGFQLLESIHQIIGELTSLLGSYEIVFDYSVLMPPDKSVWGLNWFRNSGELPVQVFSFTPIETSLQAMWREHCFTLRQAFKISHVKHTIAESVFFSSGYKGSHKTMQTQRSAL